MTFVSLLAQAGLHLVISLPLSPPHAGVVATPLYSPPSSYVKIEVIFEFSTQFISIYREALSFPFFFNSLSMCAAGSTVAESLKLFQESLTPIMVA